MNKKIEKGSLLNCRCHLPNGKTMWLCPEHQKMTRVTILTNDVILPTTHAEGGNLAEDGLLHELIESKWEQVFSDQGGHKLVLLSSIFTSQKRQTILYNFTHFSALC